MDRMKVSFYTLGCRVNQYETEMLREKFAEAGYEPVGSGEAADVYIINTCTVTGLADRKSRQHIRSMKKLNPDGIIAVTGCYAQVSAEEVAALSEVDIVIGTNRKSELVDMVSEFVRTRRGICRITPCDEMTDYEETGIITSMDSRTRAYIKVQEGCDRFCSYCMIPYARGRVRSRKPTDIMKEAEALIGKGFKEIVLTGINTALYGMEKDFAPELPVELAEFKDLAGTELLIAMISTLPGDFRIRLGSLEPTVINKDHVAGLLKYEKLCHHLHLSAQSGSDRVLGLMNRHYTREEYAEIVRVLRDFDSGYGITTDIIAGFPGETDEDFADSIKLIESCGFGRVHAFGYSKRKGTPAAGMKEQVAAATKKARTKALIEAGERAAKGFFETCRGMERRVLIEEFDEAEGLYSGYTDSYIRVYIKPPREAGLSVDSFADVRLTEPFRDGMWGEL